MKVAALVVLSVLVALPAEAAQRRQNSVSPSCDNDGRCTTLKAVSSASSKTSSFRAHRSSHQAVDANGNGIMVTVQTSCYWRLHECDHSFNGDRRPGRSLHFAETSQ